MPGSEDFIGEGLGMSKDDCIEDLKWLIIGRLSKYQGSWPEMRAEGRKRPGGTLYPIFRSCSFS